MKYKYTGSGPAFFSIGGKLTMVPSGALFISDTFYPNSSSLELVPGPGRPKKKVEKKVKDKVDGPSSSNT